MTEPTNPQRSAWELEGARLASLLDGASAVAVIGDDTAAAADVALGIARAQSLRRRVALGDLVGEEPALQRLVPDDAEHGLVDSFLYGVSLNRIAQPLDEEGSLFVLPSGAAPLDHASLLGSERWRRLAAGFREVGALLMVVAPAGAPGLERLAESLDGIVTAGDVRAVPGAVVLAAARQRAAEPAAPVPEWLDAVRQDAAARAAATNGGDGRRRPWIWVAAALAAAVLVAVVAWAAWGRMTTRTTPVPVAGRDTAGAAPAEELAANAEGVLEDSFPPADTLLFLANPGDSAEAASYVVALASYDREADATAMVRRVRERYGLPGATRTAVVVNGATWHRVTVGGSATEREADSLLMTLRARRVLQPEGGRVLEAPYTVRVGVPLLPPESERTAAALRAQGQQVYLARQMDGSDLVYVGAFERPEQAAELLTQLRAAGDPLAVLAYRIGRAQ